jgi:hypothetical protein
MLFSLAKQLREIVVNLLCTLSALELPQQLQDYTTRLASNGAESAESAVRGAEASESSRKFLHR